MSLQFPLLLGFASFVLSLFALYIYIKTGGLRLWREDPNKPYRRKVLTGGGCPILCVVVLIYGIIAFSNLKYMYIFLALILTTIIGASLGIIDDIKNIRVWRKVPIMLIPGLPLSVISLFHPLWNNTSILWIDFGIFYWIFVVPIVYMGFSNGANIIAGYDGLEGGIYLLILALYISIGALTNNYLVILISIPLFFSILAFEIYSLPPSKVLMGNVGSFPIGGLLGLIPLIGHFEIVLPIVFLPHLVEFFFKIKYRGHTSVFGSVDEKGVIHNKDGIKSVLHWIISWGNMTEKKITLAMLGIEAALCILAFGIWYITTTYNPFLADGLKKVISLFKFV